MERFVVVKSWVCLTNNTTLITTEGLSTIQVVINNKGGKQIGRTTSGGLKGQRRSQTILIRAAFQ